MSIFQRIKRVFGTGQVEVTHEATPQQRQEIVTVLREHIQRDVRGGFMNEQEIIESCVDSNSDEYDEASLREHVPVLTRELLAAHSQEQATLPTITDCDRLDTALNELEKSGIVCRQDFSCCGNCGSAEIWDEIEAADTAGGTTRGYLFYHAQDTENAVEDGTLYFNYGSTLEGAEHAVAVGQEIKTTMERNGLPVHWNGTLEKRIAIELDWKRRR